MKSTQKKILTTVTSAAISTTAINLTPTQAIPNEDNPHIIESISHNPIMAELNENHIDTNKMFAENLPGIKTIEKQKIIDFVNRINIHKDVIPFLFKKQDEKISLTTDLLKEIYSEINEMYNQLSHSKQYGRCTHASFRKC